MYKDSIFGRIRFISVLGNMSSFIIEEGNVLIVTELTDATIEYFKNNIQILERTAMVVFCITDRVLDIEKNKEIYSIIKNYNGLISINFLYAYYDNEIEEKHRISKAIDDDFTFFITTNSLRIRLDFTYSPAVIYTLGTSDPVFYTGKSGIIPEKILIDGSYPEFYHYNKHIVMINRERLGDLSTKELFESYERLFHLDIVNTIFLGFKTLVEKRYFDIKISELWQPKIEATADKLNTALEHAKETHTQWKGVYQGNGKRRESWKW